MLSLTGAFIQLQYFCVFLLAGLIGSNLFVNLLMVGVGEGAASILSGPLYGNFSDKTVVIGLAATSGIANALFYVVPKGPI